MKSKAVVHLVLAILLATLAGALTLRWLASQKAVPRPVESTPSEVAAPAKTTPVVVAAKALERGLRLTEDMLKIVPYDPDMVPPQSFSAPQEPLGRSLSRRLSPGDPVTEDKLFPKGTVSAGLEQMVEPGKRAVTVKGVRELGAGGLITPGSRVDVIMTMDEAEKADPDAPVIKESKLMLSDIPVLATGTEMEPKIGKDGREELSSTELYTLLVTPAEAEKLAYAAANHILSFALRGAADRSPVATPGADLTAILDRRSPDGAVSEAAEEPPVEVIRGLSKRHRQPKQDTVERKAAPGSHALGGLFPAAPGAAPEEDGAGQAPATDAGAPAMLVIP
jgi:pilus assembly protein CpaB